MSLRYRMEEVRVRFGRRWVLRDAALELRAGVCTVLSGRNGAGKSTLLKIVAGLHRPDRAKVHDGNRWVDWPDARRSLCRDVVYVHQHPYLFDRTVTHNVAYGLRRAGMGRAEVAARVRKALEWSGLQDRADEDARWLSEGERQRVAIARARVLEPRVLLLDEPTANMDFEARSRTCRLVRRLVADGMSIVVTTHEPQLIAQLSDLHLRLEDGEISRAPARLDRNRVSVLDPRRRVS